MYRFVLTDYQRTRIDVFVNQEDIKAKDGVTQSKISIGSGGITGAGYLTEAKADLNFTWATNWLYIL